MGSRSQRPKEIKRVYDEVRQAQGHWRVPTQWTRPTPVFRQVIITYVLIVILKHPPKYLYYFPKPPSWDMSTTPSKQDIKTPRVRRRHV